MIKVLFICHGNICRSTMAEYVMKDLVKKANLESSFYIDSAGTSNEEDGNPGTLWDTEQIKRRRNPVWESQSTSDDAKRL